MDLSAIKARMRASRERWIDVGAFGFLVRRPDQLTFMRISARGFSNKRRNLEVVLASVCDWRGITEATLLGETAAAESPQVEFDAEAFELFVGDRMDILVELAGAIGEMQAAQAGKDAEKKT